MSDQRMDHFIKSHDLKLLRSEGLVWRPRQSLVLEKILSSSGHLLVSAPTGSGKTFLFFARASKELMKKKRVVLCVTQVHLVEQARDMALQYLNIKESDISLLHGRVSTKKRAEIYKEKKPLIIIVVQDVVNDIKEGRFVFDGVTLVGLDEVHHASGEHAYVSLIKWLRSKENQIMRFGLSATPARSAFNLVRLLDVFKPDNFFCLESDKAWAQDHFKEVKLSEKNWLAIDALEEIIKLKWKQVEDMLPKQRMLLDDSSFPGWRPEQKKVPFTEFSALLALQKKVEKLLEDEKDLRMAKMRIAELGLLRWYHFLISKVSTVCFLEAFSYLLIKTQLVPYVYLPSLERHKKSFSYKKKSEDGSVGKKDTAAGFEKSLARNKRLRAVFNSLANGTPYAKYREKNLNWNLVLSRPDGPGKKDEIFSLIEEDPKKGHRALVHELESVFDYWIGESVQASRFDDAKVHAVLDIIISYPMERAIIFCVTRRQAKVLHSYLKNRLEKVDIGVELAYSVSSKKEKEQVKTAVENFDSGKSQILVTTDYGREGKDIKASIGVETVVQTDPLKQVQGRGRVGRVKHADSDLPQMNDMFYLISSGTDEMNKVYIARGRIRHMRKSLREKGVMVFDESAKPLQGFLF